MRVNIFRDITLHNFIFKILFLSQEIKKILAQGVLNIGRFECPAPDRETKIEKNPVHFKCNAGKTVSYTLAQSS